MVMPSPLPLSLHLPSPPFNLPTFRASFVTLTVVAAPRLPAAESKPSRGHWKDTHGEQGGQGDQASQGRVGQAGWAMRSRLDDGWETKVNARKGRSTTWKGNGVKQEQELEVGSGE
ncbi:hypothetical protein E2C01_090897 [Portunus trituberculatus]|uniref:Uncharacterized protein n=1 Tax=Portunus trituberculatus TaxID=210409 RepID=A0A5B7JRE0_PORTR|nr:hypothetical protein [Portunus trituberculatus]